MDPETVASIQVLTKTPLILALLSYHSQEYSSRLGKSGSKRA